MKLHGSYIKHFKGEFSRLLGWGDEHTGRPVFCAFNSALTMMLGPAMMSRCPLPWCPLNEDWRHWRRASKTPTLVDNLRLRNSFPGYSFLKSRLLVTQESQIHLFEFVLFEKRGSLCCSPCPNNCAPMIMPQLTTHKKNKNKKKERKKKISHPPESGLLWLWPSFFSASRSLGQ